MPVKRQWEIPISMNIIKTEATPIPIPPTKTTSNNTNTTNTTTNTTQYTNNAVISPTGGGKVIRNVKAEISRIENNLYAERSTVPTTMTTITTTKRTKKRRTEANQMEQNQQNQQNHHDQDNQENQDDQQMLPVPVIQKQTTQSSVPQSLAVLPKERVDTELHAAVSYGYSSDEHVANLLRNGADPNAPDKNGGRTALHIAASGAYFAGMELLMDAGADPNVQDDDGNISMHHACMGGCGKYAVDVVMYLHQTGHSKISCPNQDGDTPLHLASAIGDTACVEYLLQVGAHPEGPETYVVKHLPI